MSDIVLRGKGVGKDKAEGEALVSQKPISFFGDIDVNSGTILDPGSEIKGNNIRGKILVFPTERGSTGGPYNFYLLKRAGHGPRAVINVTANSTTVIAAIISDTPMVYQLDANPLEVIKTRDYVVVDSEKGTVVVTERR